MLAFLIVYFTIFSYFSLQTSPGNAFAVAMLDNEKTVLGAFLGLVTGRAIQRAHDAPFMRLPVPRDVPPAPKVSA